MYVLDGSGPIVPLHQTKVRPKIAGEAGREKGYGMQDWEIGFVPPIDDYYFGSPESQVAQFVRSNINPEGMTNLCATDVVVVSPELSPDARTGLVRFASDETDDSADDDYTVLEGAYKDFLSVEWRQERRDPSVVHGLDRVKKFGNLLVSSRIMAFILFYFERIESTRLYYFSGGGLACLADHLEECEDAFLNENGHMTREAGKLFCTEVRQDEILQKQKLKELSEILDEDDIEKTLERLESGFEEVDDLYDADYFD